MRNILLVDDDTVCNFISSELLKALNLVKDICIAANGNEALNIFEDYYRESNSIPDVIFLDLNLPVMDGLIF
jgi:CheY-like chemotaxis protein